MTQSWVAILAYGNEKDWILDALRLRLMMELRDHVWLRAAFSVGREAISTAATKSMPVQGRSGKVRPAQLPGSIANLGE